MHIYDAIVTALTMWFAHVLTIEGYHRGSDGILTREVRSRTSRGV